MIWRNFKTRFGVALGGAILALSLSCTSSNELEDDPIVSSESDSLEATLEEGSSSEASVEDAVEAAAEESADAAVLGGVDESFATAVVESATESTETRSPVSVNVEEAPSSQPYVDIPVDTSTSESLASLDSQGSLGAEGFTPDSGSAEAEDASPALAATSEEVVSDKSDAEAPKAALKSEPKLKSGQAFVYTVKKGDWLSKVVIKVYGGEGSWQEIAEKNGLKDPHKIEPGQKLVLEINNDASKKYSKAYGNVVFQKTTDYPSVQPDGLATIFAQPGDSLSKLSVAIYGSKENWPEIYALNKNHIADADLIFVKQKLHFKAQFPTDTSYYNDTAH